MKEIVIWGATGQAIVLEEFLGQLGYKLVALFDNNRVLESPFDSVPIYYERDGFRKWLAQKEIGKKVCFLVAIGGERGQERVSIYKMLEQSGLTAVSVAHPTSFVAGSVRMESGCQILANAAVCAKVHLGIASIINTSASVDHECKIGKGVHIGPGAKLAGCVEVGDFVFVGIGAVVLPRVKIGTNTVVGAGSVVINDLPGNVVAYGNPARIVKENKVLST